MKRRLTGSRTSGLLTIGATYGLVFINIYLTGDRYVEMLMPDALMALLIPAIGAAYGVFFFHWMFESERVAPYPDYGVFIWLVSAVVSMFYAVIVLGLTYALVQSAEVILADPSHPPSAMTTAALMVVEPLWLGLAMVVDFFQPHTGLNIALWFPLTIFCCAMGKRVGLRAVRLGAHN